MYLFIRKLLSIFFHIKYDITVHNRENIPSLKGGFIVASNHQTYTDPPAIAAVIRGKFSFMAKSELFEKNKLFAWLITRCGAFPVVRGAGDNSALEKAESDIKNGRIFVIFPEGTRSKDGVIARAKSGIAVIASAANAPVLPVCIMYAINGKKNKLDIAVGKLISAEEMRIDPDNRKDLRRVSDLIITSVRELQQQICSAYGVPVPTKANADVEKNFDKSE